MKDIGGYIELEINKVSKHYHDKALAINTARNGIVYAVQAYNIKNLWVPFYTCPVVWKAIEQTGCKLNFYNINKDLLPDKDFNKKDFILYTNYFGICSNNVKFLAQKYKNLIVDNAQAFYAKPFGLASVYSPRKFFGIPDGGYVYSKKKMKKYFEQDRNSYKRFSHLIMRIENGANFGYEDFNKNDDSLIGEDIKLMSNLTYTLLCGIDYRKSAIKRLENFNYLKKNLEIYNNFKFNITDDIPMYYPFLIENDKLRQKLIENKIYIPACWREMEKVCSKDMYELYLKKYMFLLIIDQRYDKDDMQRIVDIVRGNI